MSSLQPYHRMPEPSVFEHGSYLRKDLVERNGVLIPPEALDR